MTARGVRDGRPLPRPKALALLRSLRCGGCRRRPTGAEVEEMCQSFGHKLREGDERNLLVWKCKACCPS